MIGTPCTRGAAVFALVTLAQFSLRPLYAFDERGEPRVCAHGYDGVSDVPRTRVPWWAVSIASGMAAAVFV